MKSNYSGITTGRVGSETALSNDGSSSRSNYTNDNNDNDHDESTSFLRSGRKRREVVGATVHYIQRHWRTAGAILAACLLLTGLITRSGGPGPVGGDGGFGGRGGGPQQKIIEVNRTTDDGDGGATVNKILYRPVCEYYYTPPSFGSSTAKTAPIVIQTSMQEPSKQWAPMACFPAANPIPSQPKQQQASASASQANNARTEPSRIVELNKYGAPDAIFRVNFTQLAFPRKSTPILGFGGAFTEASALNYRRLSEQGRAAVMELLFGGSGLGYGLGRVPINSCDFSIGSYSFDEVEDDFKLKHFDAGVTHDVESGMIDMALRAVSVFRQAWAPPPPPTPTDKKQQGFGGILSHLLNNIEGSDNDNDDAAADARDGSFKLIASPWSPPSWMKKPTWEDRKHGKHAVHAAKMTYSGTPNCLRDGVGRSSRYAKAWALYFSKFASAYSRLGLPLWAVTVQNEPEFAAPWEACSYTPRTQHDFVAHHLGPTLRRDHPGTKLLIFDHNKDHINVWAEKLLNASSKAAQYVDGTSYHWYAGGMDRLLDGAIGNPNLHRFQDKLDRELNLPADRRLLLGTEACHCPSTGYAGGDISVYWSRAERYAHTILADLAAGSNGWIEWNLILDGIGGPNHLGNICESTLLAVPHRETGADPVAVPPLPDFELKKPMGNVSIGDGRTLEELNALGFPAKFLEVGVAVQPIYYYMGHISRHVRPGSVAVAGLVDQAHGGSDRRIFRPEGQVVPGGGLNDLARNGIEVTVWPCEGSTRQQFHWDGTERTTIQVFGHDWLGAPTTFCVERKVDKDLMGLRLTACDKGTAGKFKLIPIADENRTDLYHIKLDNSYREECLVIEELKNNGGAYGRRGGAQASLGSCSHESAKWIVNESNGEVMSTYFSGDENDNDSDNGEVCMTTGWPFLQMGAFLTPNGQREKTVVILNEARDSANYALQDETGVVLTGTVPPRSIQTMLID